MAPTTPEDTVKFLVACIQHSAAGKINWQAVADECGIPTKNAASMRYSRLLKAHGVANPVAPGGGGGVSRASTPGNSPTKPRGTPKNKNKKKQDVAADGEGDGEDLESPSKKRKANKMKAGDVDEDLKGDEAKFEDDEAFD